jgi:hypothetical protein
MSENALSCSRYVESFLPPPLLDKVVLSTQHSVVDAFLGEIEYGKDYIVSTELVKENWADGFGMKYTYFLKFDEIVRCKDCRYYEVDGWEQGWCCHEQYYEFEMDPDGYCSRGEKHDED